MMLMTVLVTFVAKGARATNEAFKQLATDACLTVHAIVSSPSLTLHEGRKFPRELLQNLEILIE